MEEYYIKIKLTKEEFERLREQARRHGFASVTDYVRWVLAQHAEGREAPAGGVAPEALKSLLASLERRIMDLLNPYTGKIDEINLKLSRIIEMIETLELARRDELDRGPQEYREPRPAAREQRKYDRGEYRGDAIARLREEGILFQDEAGWIRSPQRFFASLEKRGAVVLNIEGKYVAVDKNYWERFRSILEELDVSDSIAAERIIAEKLGERAGRLFREMVRAGIAVFDEDKGSWILYLPP
ncbi:conserved hypothetical protein [Aeropyrum pernix K1]|uniref:Uncharacterized protein n=1 Tax=Aeropyrum pernix (strain ATCC 700893 / DSM 11879 / JCM 9820 / NBRC 100138 / K1) TaxID=272557 RepID=Q9YC90_AERPE|nr:hypothetical protein [Aeropyrum pernix]BAA80358.2 conserved hypothetical protein [Aeropyrum pernix K1]